MSKLYELLRLDAALGKLEWAVLVVLLLSACVLLHPRVLRAWRWGERAPRPSPPREGADSRRYRRRSG